MLIKKTTALAIILLLSASLLLVPATSLIIFSLISANLVGLFGLYLFIKQPHLIRFSNALAESLLLGYCLGSIIFVVGSYLSTGHIDFTNNVFGLKYRLFDVSLALMLVMISSAVLFLMGNVERSAFSPLPIPDFSLYKAKILVWLSSVIILIAFIRGDLGYMGSQVSQQGNVTVLGSIAFILTPTFVPLTILVVMKEQVLRRKLLLTFPFVILLLALMPLGRRVLVYSLLCGAFAVVISGRWRLRSITRKLPRILIAFLGFVIIYFAYIGFEFFYALRLAQDRTSGSQTLFEYIPLVLQMLRNPDESALVAEKLASNVQARPFILSYLAGLVAAHSNHSPLWGREFFYAVQSSIPSLFFSNKTIILPFAVECFVHPKLGFSYFDGPASIITAGLNDFGMLGAILYPIMLPLIYMAINRVARQILPAFLFYFVTFRLIYQLFYVENSLSAMITTGLRDLVITTFLLWLVWKVPVPPSKKSLGRL